MQLAIGQRVWFSGRIHFTTDGVIRWGYLNQFNTAGFFTVIQVEKRRSPSAHKPVQVTYIQNNEGYTYAVVGNHTQFQRVLPEVVSLCILAKRASIAETSMEMSAKDYQCLHNLAEVIMGKDA